LKCGGYICSCLKITISKAVELRSSVYLSFLSPLPSRRSCVMWFVRWNLWLKTYMTCFVCWLLGQAQTSNSCSNYTDKNITLSDSAASIQFFQTLHGLLVVVHHLIQNNNIILFNLISLCMVYCHYIL